MDAAQRNGRGWIAGAGEIRHAGGGEEGSGRRFWSAVAGGGALSAGARRGCPPDSGTGAPIGGDAVRAEVPAEAFAGGRATGGIDRSAVPDELLDGLG